MPSPLSPFVGGSRLAACKAEGVAEAEDEAGAGFLLRGVGSAFAVLAGREADELAWAEAAGLTGASWCAAGGFFPEDAGEVALSPAPALAPSALSVPVALRGSAGSDLTQSRLGLLSVADANGATVGRSWMGVNALSMSLRVRAWL